MHVMLYLLIVVHGVPEVDKCGRNPASAGSWRKTEHDEICSSLQIDTVAACLGDGVIDQVISGPSASAVGNVDSVDTIRANAGGRINSQLIIRAGCHL